jgi:hypothetical protein
MKLSHSEMHMYTGWNNPKYTYAIPDFIVFCTDGVPWNTGQLYTFLFED